MPEKQSKIFGTALSYKRGDITDVSKEIRDIADSMSEKDLELFASKTDSMMKNEKDSDREIQMMRDMMDSMLIDIITNTLTNTISESKYNNKSVNTNRILYGENTKYKIYLKHPTNENIVKFEFGSKK